MDVRIPAVAVAAVVMDGHKPGARLDQPPRHQAGLTEEMTAVAVTQRRRFALQIEGLARPWACDKAEGPLADLIDLERSLAIDDPPLGVERFEERGPATDPGDVVGGDRIEPLDTAAELAVGAITPVGVVGGIPPVDPRRERIDRRSQPAAVFPRADILAVLLEPAEAVGNDGIRGQIAQGALGAQRAPGTPLLEVLHHRANRRPVLRRGTEATADGDLPAFARLDVVAAAAVVVEIVRHRADDTVAVGDFCQLREVLADPQAWRPAADRAHWPADVGRRVRLHVEGFVLARAAEEEQEDHRLGPWLRARGNRLGGEDFLERCSQQPCSPDL